MPDCASTGLECWEADVLIFGQVVSSTSITWNVPDAIVVGHAVKVGDIVTARLCQVALILPAAIHLLEVFEVDLIVF